MRVPAGLPFTARLLGPAGLGGIQLGARIEVPVTRAVVGYWRPAVQGPDSVWEVELEAPPLTSPDPNPAIVDALASRNFLIVWRDSGPEGPGGRTRVEIFVPLRTDGRERNGDGARGDGCVFATLEELAIHQGAPLLGADGERAEALLRDASAVIEAIAGHNWNCDPPDVINTICLNMALRGFDNPKGIRQQTLGDLSMTFGSVDTGVTVTDDERALIRSAARTADGALRLT